MVNLLNPFRFSRTQQNVSPPPGPHRYWGIRFLSGVEGFTETGAAQIILRNSMWSANLCKTGGAVSCDKANASVNTPPANTVDGRIHSGSNAACLDWATATAQTFPILWSYDLGSGNDAEVNVVEIHARYSTGRTAQSFEVVYSDDGSTWTVAWTVRGAPLSPDHYEKFARPGLSIPDYSGSPHGAHTYWRLSLKPISTNLCLTEMEFRATPGGADQCSGGTASVSSNFNGTATYQASNLVDNSGSTIWHSVNSSVGDYVQYQFASPVSVAEIALTSRNAGSPIAAPNYITVQYSDNGVDWTTAWHIPEINRTGTWALNTQKVFTDPYYQGSQSAFAKTYAAQLVIPAGMIQADLVQFPLYIPLSKIAAYGVFSTSNGGKDLRVEVDGVQCPTDLISFDAANSRGTIYAKADFLTAADAHVVDIFWDGVSIIPALFSDIGMFKVWSEYDFVLHGNGIFDHTGKCRESVYGGTIMSSFGWPSGNDIARAGGAAISLSGSQWMDFYLGEVSQNGGSYTFMTSAKNTSTAQDTAMGYHNKDAAGGSDATQTLAFDDGTFVGIWDSTNGWLYGMNGWWDPGTSDWIRWGAVYSGSSYRQCFFHGDYSQEAPITTRAAGGYDSIKIGAEDNSNAEIWTGDIGWSYLRSEALAPSWLRTEFDMLDLDCFYIQPNQTLTITDMTGHNVDLELGTGSGWTLTNFTVGVPRSPLSVAKWGSYCLVGDNGAASGSAVRDLSVSTWATEIDAGNAYFRIRGAIGNDSADNDTGIVTYECYDGSNVLKGTFYLFNVAANPTNNSWGNTERLTQFKIPATTRTIRINCQATRVSTGNLNIVFDFQTPQILTVS